MPTRPWLPLLVVDGALLLASQGSVAPRGVALSFIALFLAWTLRQLTGPLSIGIAFVAGGVLLGGQFPFAEVTTMGGLLVLYDVLHAVFRIGADNTVAFGSKPLPRERPIAGVAALVSALVLAFGRVGTPLLPAFFLFVLAGVAISERVRRYAVLGAFERIERIIQLAAVATFGALMTSIVDPSLGWFLFLGATLLVLFLARTKRFERFLPLSRTAALQFVYGAPVIAVAWLVFAPRSTLLAGALGGLGSLVVSAVAAARERTFLDDQGKLLGGLEEARADLHLSEDASGLTSALLCLRRLAPPSDRTSPRIYSFFARTWKSVDAAGYPSETSLDEPPMAFLELAKAEPFGILRREALASMEVRRSDLRAALDWFDARGVWLLVVLQRGEHDEGVLVLPRWNRTHPLIVEEAQALQRLATELAWLEHFTSGEKRSLLREQGSEQQKTAAEEERSFAIARTARVKAREDRLDARAKRLANFAQHSPRMLDARSLALDLLRTRRHFAMVAASGSRAIEAVATLRHELGLGQTPFVVVDTAYPEEVEEGAFLDDARSPLALAEDGHLIVLGHGALPRRVLELLGNYVGGGRFPFSGDKKPTLIFLSSRPFEEGPLESELETPLVSLQWPRVAARDEDKRALLQDELARRGLRARGKPLGMSDDAYARVVESTFGADELHIEALAAILVEVTEGDVVDRKAMDAALARLDLRSS